MAGTLNPHTMTARQIACSTTPAQLADAIGRATVGMRRAALAGQPVAGWCDLINKLTEAMRINRRPARLVAVQADGLAVYRGAEI